MRPQGQREVTRQLKRLHLLPTQLNCPECGRRLSKLATWCPGLSEERQRRCWSRECPRTTVHPLQGHPFFTINSHSPSLALQASMLSALLHKTKQADVHIQLNVPHATVERMAKRLRVHLRDHVGQLGPNITSKMFFSFWCPLLSFLLFLFSWFHFFGLLSVFVPPIVIFSLFRLFLLLLFSLFSFFSLLSFCLSIFLFLFCLGRGGTGEDNLRSRLCGR